MLPPSTGPRRTRPRPLTLTEFHGHHHDRAEGPCAVDQAEQAVSAIGALTGTGRAGDVITLARGAMRLLAEAVESVDDSDGWLGQVGADLAGVHLDACRAARPDPEELARWLVGHALGDVDDGLTDIDPLDYGDVLGAEGVAVLRKLAVEAWQGNRRGWPEKYLMERVAKAGGDVDAVIAVHAGDLLPNGHTHLVIARELDTARRPDEALYWAERGIQNARDLAAVDTAPVDYLCDRCTQEDRLHDAVTLRRDHFGARHTPPTRSTPTSAWSNRSRSRRATRCTSSSRASC